MKYYSQYGEDRLLNVVFGRNTGTCIEVGANDGVTYSTTKFFEDLGWTCILVEPTPALCTKIREGRTSKLFECAASSADGFAELGYVEDIDLFSSLETSSTMLEQVEARGAKVTSIKVRTRLVDDILTEAEVNKLDFMTIDVEGHELDVLKGTNLDRWQPMIVIVEDNTDLSESPVSLHLFEKKYSRFYRSGGNDWYRRNNSSFGIGAICKLVLSNDMGFVGVIRAIMPVPIRSGILRSLRFVRGIKR
jgi:FkbM family methyltransferase